MSPRPCALRHRFRDAAAARRGPDRTPRRDPASHPRFAKLAPLDAVIGSQPRPPRSARSFRAAPARAVVAPFLPAEFSTL